MSLTYTDALGNYWTVDNYGNVSSARAPYTSGGYQYNQYTLDSTSLSLYVGGSTNTTSLTLQTYAESGNTHTATLTNTTAGISLTRKTYIADGYVRVLEIVTNTGSVATTAAISLNNNIYYDSNTQTVATSSGDATRTTDDDWSTFGSTNNALLPRLTHVVSGGAGSPDGVSQPYTDQPNTTFNLNLAAGETQVIMHFYALSADTASASSIGNSLANLTSDAYLAGMTEAEMSGLVNFTKNITASTTTTLPSYGLNLTLTGASNINGTGNSLDNLITGNSGANKLYGVAGNDTLSGGAGNDTMYGGAGNDTYVVGQAGDSVVENANAGIDTVQSSISFSLAALPYVENIVLTGASAKTATGNSADNVLDGSQSSGADTLIGGLGNDTYIFGAGDVIVENAAEGIDTVHSTATLTLAANLENLVLTGSANIGGTGNSAANKITGNAGRNKLTGSGGNDTLDGGAGVDTMLGGVGNDSYYVDHLGDIVTEAANAGTDTVYACKHKLCTRRQRGKFDIDRLHFQGCWQFAGKQTDRQRKRQLS